ncbi:hypothetical protein CLH62_12205 [Marinobacter guineae]|uniref:Uncharacterized protein n=1 Tax=Marinobacter guineae TaxID=432303 RepID=A0A2G1VEA2_9GAMM|nr:hypothetical protein CLH62_12205 [Marinobacter guineae]
MADLPRLLLNIHRDRKHTACGASAWEILPKMLGAKDGGEQAYRDVFTAVFGRISHDDAAITETRN